MISLNKIEPPILFPRPAVLIDGGDPIPGLSREWDQPDIKRNPQFWLKLYLEGWTLHRRSFALASRADRILDLGCGGGWFPIYLAGKRSNVEIDAIDTDGRLLDWGRLYADRLKTKGRNLGKIRFSEADVDEFPWDEHEEAFDLVHAGFILSRVKDPIKALDGIYKALKPGGWVIYHDCTDPPSRNLNRLARVQHALVGLYNQSSDPWSWRRTWDMRYLFDTVRAKARREEPRETEVVRRLEELFALRYQVRRRALLDLALKSKPRATFSRQALFIPLVKLADDLLCVTDQLVGATRYVLGQKR
ncbi:MAG: class I SAM-dependent methyltransferase [Vulcanimicrobiota bacterium]